MSGFRGKAPKGESLRGVDNWAAARKLPPALEVHLGQAADAASAAVPTWFSGIGAPTSVQSATRLLTYEKVKLPQTDTKVNPRRPHRKVRESRGNFTDRAGRMAARTRHRSGKVDADGEEEQGESWGGHHDRRQ